MRRRHLTDRVSQQEIGADTPRLQQPEQRDLKREDRRLRTIRPVQRHLVVNRNPVEPRTHLVPGGREDRERLVQLTAHPHPLGALAGEQERQTARHDRTIDQVVPDQNGTVRQPRPRGGERERHVGHGRGERADGLDLLPQRLGRSRRHHKRCGHIRHRARLDGLDLGCLLDHHVRVGPADTERGHPGPPG
jgi:hypothetical protein